MVFWNLQVDFVLMITKSCPGSDSASIGKGGGRRSKKGIKVHTWFETFYVGNDNPDSNPQSILAMNPSWGNKTKKDADSIYPSKSFSFLSLIFHQTKGF